MNILVIPLEYFRTLHNKINDIIGVPTCALIMLSIQRPHVHYIYPISLATSHMN